MVKWLYNLALLLVALLGLPKFLWEMLRHRKHYQSLRQKLGFHLPTFSLPTDSLRIWVHSISVGETKAVAPLVKRIQEQVPHASLVISTTTETGLAEARRSMPNLQHYFFLPLDFSWAIRRLLRRLQPHLLILVEGDFWYNLVTHVDKVVLVNGKISETSLTRFLLFPFFTKKLFAAFDFICVQSQRFAQRFEALGVDPAKILSTGNLKFDQPFSPLDLAHWKKKLGVKLEDRVIVIGSTHETEEERLIDVLTPLFERFPTLKIVLAPRHPERFPVVITLLEKKGIAFARFSDHASHKEDYKILLIDAMGMLSACYQLAEIAIVGGSFIKHVGGHNIFEPAALGVPVLFGPYMESQKDLVDLVLDARAGKQLTLKDIAPTVEQLLAHPSQEMKEAGLKLAQEVHGATERTFNALRPFLIV